MITFIGLGPMGQAMVRVLLKAGQSVTVWNRTAGRADSVVEAGAVRAATVAEALKTNQLVILSLTDYQAMYQILDGQSLAGKVVVNLSSDTPDRTREAAAWLAERGAELIVGGVMVPAPLVGSDAAYVFYSGPKEVFDSVVAVLRLIGRPDYLGSDHILAQMFYQAQLDIFLTSLSAYLHASALLKSVGVSAEAFASYAAENFGTLSMYVAGAAANIDSGSHPGDQASVIMMGATADHIVGASRSAGVDPGLPEAVKAQYDRAIAAGYGTASWTSLFEVLKRQ
jgi:3-hydroxyisobutyrate dehydrogenase-like beta-hydroxyacid dehydrogenase